MKKWMFGLSILLAVSFCESVSAQEVKTQKVKARPAATVQKKASANATAARKKAVRNASAVNRTKVMPVAKKEQRQLPVSTQPRAKVAQPAAAGVGQKAAVSTERKATNK